MPLNLKNFINTQAFKSKMNDFQDLEHIDGVSISAVCANLYTTNQEMIWLCSILEMEQIMPLFIHNQK